jgi:pSer/pThr/pTyr-binding forkhead associated (FHA) protein
MASVFCTQCGQQNPEDARFCARCGAVLTVPGEGGGAGATAAEQTSTLSMTGIDGADDHPAGEVGDVGVESLPVGTALLVVKRGPNAGSRFLLDKDLTTAGRHPESDIFLDDVTVSRRHAEFAREGDAFVVRDVGSLNGTYLSRERIEEAALSNGDEVQIGKFRLVYLTSPSEEAR